MNRIRISIAATSIAIILLALAPLATVAPASAEQALSQWPRQCRTDIKRACRDVVQEDDKTVLSCLQDNAAKISQGCRKLLQSYGHVPETPATNSGKRRR